MAPLSRPRAVRAGAAPTAVALARERVHVDLLVLRLLELRRLDDEGDGDLLLVASDAVDRAAGAARAAGLDRALAASAWADSLGRPGDCALPALLPDAPDAWRQVLVAAADALRASAAEIAVLRAAERARLPSLSDFLG